MRRTRETIYKEGALIEASVAKKMTNYDEIAASRSYHMSYHALETPREDEHRPRQLPPHRAGHREERKEFRAGGLDECARHLVQSNFQKFLRWISCMRSIRYDSPPLKPYRAWRTSGVKIIRNSDWSRWKEKRGSLNE